MRRPDKFEQMVERIDDGKCYGPALLQSSAIKLLRSQHAQTVRLVKWHFDRCPQNGTPENIGYLIACAEILAKLAERKKGKP